MPPLAIHTSIAKQMADGLTLAALDAERGNLYLGSTAPDIRALTRWERQRTHYFDIHNFGEQYSVQAFLDANPALAEAEESGPPRTLAFIAGYLTHLVTDEMWIGAIYRPYFGERSPLGGTLRANIMDRALQFSMDADVRSNNDELMLHVIESVACCDADVSIDFIDRDTLNRWHEVITDFVPVAARLGAIPHVREATPRKSRARRWTPTGGPREVAAGAGGRDVALSHARERLEERTQRFAGRLCPRHQGVRPVRLVRGARGGEADAAQTDAA